MKKNWKTYDKEGRAFFHKTCSSCQMRITMREMQEGVWVPMEFESFDNHKCFPTKKIDDFVVPEKVKEEFTKVKQRICPIINKPCLKYDCEWWAYWLGGDRKCVVLNLGRLLTS